MSDENVFYTRPDKRVSNDAVTHGDGRDFPEVTELNASVADFGGVVEATPKVEVEPEATAEPDGAGESTPNRKGK